MAVQLYLNVAGLLAAGITFTSYGPAYGHDGSGRGSRDEAFVGASLTPAQEQQVQAIEQASHAATAQLRSRLHDLSDEIDARLASAGAVTEAELAPLLEQQEAVRARLDAQDLRDRIAARALLSPDQLAGSADARTRLAALRLQERAIEGARGDR